MIVLHSLRLHLGKQRLDAFVRVDGVLRKIEYRWKTREKTDTPPAEWFDLVKEEARQQHVKSGSRIQWLPPRK
jgi:hypothetical protein